MVSQPRPTDDELREERAEGLARIRSANAGLMERAADEGVRFQLDDDGTLRVTIGSAPDGFYAQRIGRVRFNLNRVNDEIAGFVIERIDDYLIEHPHATDGFRELLPALRRLRVVELPPRSANLEVLRESFGELLPA